MLRGTLVNTGMFGESPVTPVKLSFVNEGELQRLGENGGEAQPISVRLPSATSLYINSRLIQGPGIDKTNLIVTNRNSGAVTNYAGALIENASKITVTRFSPYMVSPNVNPRNNTLRLVYDTGSASGIDVTVAEGWYLTPEDLMAALETAINTALGIAGAGFTVSHVVTPDGGPASPFKVATFTAAPLGRTFTFLTTSVGYQNGKSLWNSPAGGPLAGSARFGPIGLIYTRTLDVCSREITRYARRYDTTINPDVPRDLLFRVTLGPGTLISPNPYGIPAGEVNTSGFGDALQLDTFTFDSSQVITSIDIRVLDQYGLPLYVPDPVGPGGPPQNGFDWNLHFFVQ